LAFVIWTAQQTPGWELGLDYGFYGVENYDPNVAGYGIHLFWNVSDRTGADLSFSHWGGEDGNFTTMKRYHDSYSMTGSFFGNTGISFALHYCLMNRDGWRIALGGGFSGWEKVKVNDMTDSYINTYSLYESGVDVSALIRKELTKKLFCFVKLRGSVPLDFIHNGVPRPNWGNLSLGLAYCIFR